MKVIDLLNNSKDKTTISFEFIPPKKGLSKKDLILTLDPLMEYNPLFVDVTMHRNAVELVRNGSKYEGFTYQKFPSSLLVCESIREKYDVEVVPHVICGGFSKEDTEDILLDMVYLGYQNVVALQGDKLSIEKSFTPHPEGHRYAYQLIGQIKQLNEGISLHSNSYKSDFCIGAGCYPEKHYTLPNIEREIEVCKCKQNAGAEYFISQMCFDIDAYLTFYSNMLANNIKQVIPGIKVIANSQQIYRLPQSFYINFPEKFVHDMQIATNPTEVGVDFAVDYCNKLLNAGIKHLHFYTMNSIFLNKVLKKLL